MKMCFLLFSSQQPNYDYHAEVQAFSSRLHENISPQLLKTAFINPCYLESEQERRHLLGMDTETTALVLHDNYQLNTNGLKFTKDFLEEWCRASFPCLPTEGVSALVGHLTSHAVVCHVARNLAVEDLAMSAKFPVPDEVLHRTFMAVIGALQESSGAERAGLFLRVRTKQYQYKRTCIAVDNICVHVMAVSVQFSGLSDHPASREGPV